MSSRLECGRKPHVRRAAVCVVLCLGFFFALTGGLAAQAPPAAPSTSTFTFTNVDLEFLEKSNELDRNMDERGLVYSDPALTEYVTALGDDLLPPGPDP